MTVAVLVSGFRRQTPGILKVASQQAACHPLQAKRDKLLPAKQRSSNWRSHSVPWQEISREICRAPKYGDTPYNQRMDTSVTIIGAGPAGLMAAEIISAHGVNVDVYDSMPSVARKFLMAGKSGLNITHAESF